MGFIGTETADSDPEPSADSERVEPTPDELRTYLIEQTDQTAAELEEQMTGLQTEIPFLSDIAAYYLLGQQLDIDLAEVFDTKRRDFSLDVGNLHPGMNSVDLTATIKQITPINEFTRDDGSDGKVCNLVVTDSTGSAVITLWDENTAITTDLEQGDTIRVEGGYTKPASDYCQSRFDCTVEVRIGEGSLFQKTDETWIRRIE